ncbi:MAG: hypothetical protein EF806_04405 [Candidatus Methanoliparum thermophilum]|uniref:Uncharacterized protein n=1 Tax=Methanoliparum thermophilum TaxID=2491083 RepID=A0A520KSJ9_METT2|nr:MAG: hypothetical protein EF806_04405 [Candidatus Methanoliparum thermophilum]
MGMMVDPTNILPILPIALVISFASTLVVLSHYISKKHRYTMQSLEGSTFSKRIGGNHRCRV